jgi:hypothetical protein
LQIRKTAHNENLAGSDGSTQWLNVLHQANRSTADKISIYTQIAQSEENLLTVKKNCSQKSNLLKKLAHSRNLLTEFARSI